MDEASRDLTVGWALPPAPGEGPARLSILVDGAVVGHAVADRFRMDLARHGLGACGFAFTFETALSPLCRHVVSVQWEANGQELPGSPVVVPPLDAFGPALETVIAAAVGALDGTTACEAALSFLLEQAGRVRQRIADHAAGPARHAIHRPTSAARPGGRRALVIDQRMPDARPDAGSHALPSHMRALQELGHAVSFVAADEMTADAEPLTAAAISLCRSPVYSCVEDVLRRQAGAFDVVYIHKADSAARYLVLARRYQPKARIVYSVGDLHHRRIAGQAEVERRPDLLAVAERLRAAEYLAAWSADAVLTHTEAEADELRHGVPAARVHVVPWAVPTRPTAVPWADRRGLAFIGGYGDFHNRDAVEWLVSTVMPLVWRTDPAMTCTLMGRDMPPSLRRLEQPRIVAKGDVDDLGREVFDRVRLTVAPLRFGAGLTGEALDSLAAGVPCAMTPIAAEGLGLGPALLECVGRDAQGLAACILRLHSDAAYNAKAVEAGLALTAAGFTAETTRTALAAAVGLDGA